MVDVTVRGAGVFGLSVAWACARRGARVKVIDPQGPAAGASGGIVGALAPHVPENWNQKKDFQFRSLVMAGSFWAEVAAAGGADPGYLRSGRLQPLADEHAVALARQREVTARRFWRDEATWRVVEAAAYGAWAPPSATGLLIHDTLAARIHPRQACAALVAACEALGAEVVAEAPDAGAVVWATGVHDLVATSVTGRALGNGVKGQAALLRHDARRSPQLFADALHIVPHADGTVAIGSTSERDYTEAATVDAQLDAVIDRAMAAFPVLRGAEVIERWAGVRPRSRSRAPVLGPHPVRPGAYIANGGFKIGFGMAPLVGEVMADLVLEGRDTVPEAFRPEA